MRVLVAFDVDGTLTCGSPPGPIEPRLLRELKKAGFTVGIVGNYERALKVVAGLDFYLEGDPFKAENLARVASAFKPCLAIYVADLPSDREAALKAGFIYVSPRDLPLSLPRLPCTLGPLVPYGNACPTVDPSAYVDPSSRLVGRVCIGPGSAVFFGAVLRAEEGELVGGHLRAGDLLPLAVLLDLKYYRAFLGLVGRFRGAERRRLLEVVGPRIDAAVVKSVYRLKEWGAEELLRTFAVGRCFRIRYADIVGLGPEEVLKVAAAAYSCEAELESVERAARAEGFRRANSAFLKGLLTSVPVVAVVELKRYEVTNLVAILRGLSLGLAGKELEGLVIR